MTMLLFHSLYQDGFVSEILAIIHNIITKEKNLQVYDENIFHFKNWGLIILTVDTELYDSQGEIHIIIFNFSKSVKCRKFLTYCDDRFWLLYHSLMLQKFKKLDVKSCPFKQK